MLSKIQNFLAQEDSNVRLITGAAGTGKTTLIKDIIEQLNCNNTKYNLLAPTGRATRNLYEHVSDISDYAVSTIHSFLYQKNDEKNDENSEILKFSIRTQNLDESCVTIIDEASMLSHETVYEKAFLQFGSGNLFDDLLLYLKLNASKRKLILVGDPFQLPPVKAHSAEVLNLDFLQKKIQSANIEHLKLEEVHRQKCDSAILKSSTQLKNAIEKTNFLQFTVEPESNQIEDISFEQALEQYLWDYGNDAIFLSYTNKDVHHINLKFRALNQLNAQLLEKKERLILMRNSWIKNQYYFNGDFFIIESLGIIETVSVSLRDKGNFKITFQDIEIRKENEISTFSTKILLDEVWREDNTDSVEEMQALVIHFRQRYPNLKRNSPEYKSVIQNDPYINALYMRFGYAMTCHKAQGGEWNKVYINLARPQNDLKTLNGIKWSYTALTRAKQKVYLMHRPKSNQNFDIDYPFSILINEIKIELAKSNYELLRYKEHNYELQLFIQKEKVISGLKFYRDKKMKITKIMEMKKTEYTTDLKNIFNKYISISLVER